MAESFFVHSDRLQRSYKTITKRLQKLQDCNKYLPLGTQWVSTEPARVYVLSGALCQCICLKELRLRSWGAAFGGMGNCVSKGVTSKRSVAAVGATTLDY